MRRNRKAVFLLCMLFVFQIACGRKDHVYLERKERNVSVMEIDASSDKKYADTEKASGDATDEGFKRDKEPDGSKERAACYVYVCGAVREPGVYVLSEGGRIYEAVALAGGLTEEAGAEYINQAELVADGMMIRIPTEEEAAKSLEQAVKDSSSGEKKDDRINLNTATAADLMQLPGIGQSKADSIIAYREKHSGFSSVADIMNVDGIKEGVYNRIKDKIKVN